MNREKCTATLEPDGGFSVDHLESRVHNRLFGLVSNFQLVVYDGGIVLHVGAHTYHAKQLAQHVVMRESELPILADEIEVR